MRLSIILKLDEMIINERFTKKLLVEGNDDQHIIWALCNKFSLLQNFDVIDCNGINNLIEQIPIRIKQSGIDTIGLIIDADIDIESKWNSLTRLFSSLGYTFPPNLPQDGLIINEIKKIKIGVWIMPNNEINGMVEDFIKFLIPDEDNLLIKATNILNEIESLGLNKYLPVHKSKALIHTWLAWQEDPGMPMGLAITKSFLNADKEICSTFINWLSETFKT